MITIYTPTYNRAQCLGHLYQSLMNQTDLNFEWLIVDDGSTDETRQIVEMFKADGVLKIRYIHKENGGVNSVMDCAAQNTENEIIWRVDSDDSIKENAVEQIYANWHLVAHDDSLVGLVFLSENRDGTLVGKHPFKENFKSNFFDYQACYGASGDRAEVCKTRIMKEYPFPSFPGEKFCPEGLMWNRVAQKYGAIYIPQVIHIRNVESGDAISRRIVETLKKNSMGSLSYYSELLNMCKSRKIKLLYYLKNSILFWRYALSDTKLRFSQKLGMVPLSAFIGIVVAIPLLILDNIKK